MYNPEYTEQDQKDLFEHVTEFLKSHSAREVLMIVTDALEAKTKIIETCPKCHDEK